MPHRTSRWAGCRIHTSDTPIRAAHRTGHRICGSIRCERGIGYKPNRYLALVVLLPSLWRAHIGTSEVLPAATQYSEEHGPEQVLQEDCLSLQFLDFRYRASRGGGIVRPRALAVFRSITNRNFVGCSNGSSPGHWMISSRSEVWFRHMRCTLSPRAGNEAASGPPRALPRLEGWGEKNSAQKFSVNWAAVARIHPSVC